jgi:hypothetical protein
MRRLILAAAIAAACAVLYGYSNEPEGFLDDPWGYRVAQWLKDNPGAKKAADDGGFVWYTPERRVSLSGIPVQAKYGFWKDKLTEVRITFGEGVAGRVKDHLFGRYGDVPDNGNLMYTWFGYTTEIHLNSMDNELKFVSHELGQKAENRIKRGAAADGDKTADTAAEPKDKGKKKSKKK